LPDASNEGVIQTGMALILSKKLLRRLAWLTAGLLLFTQLILAAQACMLPGSNPAYTLGDAMATEECESAPMDKGTCLAYCLKADQVASPSVDFHFNVILPPAFPVAALSALRQVDGSAMPLAVSQPASGPPLQILFCSFQT
jgi:hypothetical protein